MKSKEDILEIIANAKEKGITLTGIAGTRKKKETAPVKDILGKLVTSGKITKSGNRFFLSGVKKKRQRKTKNYITREEVEGIVGEIYKDMAHLKDQIDRAFEYVDEIFLNLRSKKEKASKLPSGEEMLIAYDNVNRRENAGDSVPIPDFKKELKKMGFTFEDEEINKKLLEMDNEEIIYLQQANNPEELDEREKGINTDRGFLFYITWIKRF